MSVPIVKSNPGRWLELEGTLRVGRITLGIDGTDDLVQTIEIGQPPHPIRPLDGAPIGGSLADLLRANLGETPDEHDGNDVLERRHVRITVEVLA